MLNVDLFLYLAINFFHHVSCVSWQPKPKQVPRTTENTRVVDDTIVEPHDDEVITFEAIHSTFGLYWRGIMMTNVCQLYLYMNGSARQMQTVDLQIGSLRSKQRSGDQNNLKKELLERKYRQENVTKWRRA